jgi:hypothetical protein
MPAGSTYTPIATTTLGSTQTSYTFTSIPSTYTDLVLVINAGMATLDDYPAIQVGNGSIDTGSNYSKTELYGTGSAAASFRDTSTTAFYCPVINSTNAGGYNAIFNFQNYSNTTTNKTVLYRTNNAASNVSADVGLWRSTSAINQIKVGLYYGTGGRAYVAGSTFTLYGIAAA